jgi:small GTP-binding protein
MTFDSLTDFHIKVALIGYVSVGKTTILNALLRDKFGEVAMGRATASVNYYCCTSKPLPYVFSASSVTTGPMSWSGAGLPTPAAEIYEQTVRDNARLRHADKVEETWFDIVELDQDLCPMRDDTKLVVVDIPGINEAGTSSKYKDYIAQHWHSFDCVVVVMDGRQGVNTEEQVELLKLTKSNCDRIKNVPVIVLCNKIDDPDDKEQSVLIQEARQVVQKVFGTEDQVKTLHDVLAASGSNPDRGSLPFPKAVLLPVSAIHAFIYQAGALLDYEQFKSFDDEMIEKLGKDFFGRAWRHWNKEQKVEKAFEVISDGAHRLEGFELSNFDKFVALLSYCVGGANTQEVLLRAQIRTALSRLTPTPGVVLAKELYAIHIRCKTLKIWPGHLPDHFWTGFDQISENSFASFKTPADVHVLAKIMQQLFAYAQLVKEVRWDREVRTIIDKAKAVIGRQATVIMNQFDRESVVDPADLVLLYGSFMLQGSESFFFNNFGLLKILMEDRARVASRNSNSYEGTGRKERACHKTQNPCRLEELPGQAFPIWKCKDCLAPYIRCGTTNCPVWYLYHVNGHVVNSSVKQWSQRTCNCCRRVYVGVAKEMYNLNVCCMKKCKGQLKEALELRGDGTAGPKVKQCAICKTWHVCFPLQFCPECYQQHKSKWQGVVDGKGYCGRCGSQHTFYNPSLPQYNMVNGVLTPVDGPIRPSIVVPESLEDPRHFGHLVWQFGQIARLLGKG